MRLAAILLIMASKSLCLWCVDGSDCDSTCSFCEGAACLRVQRSTSTWSLGSPKLLLSVSLSNLIEHGVERQHPIRGVTTAMTCLPHDSLIHSYHPEGCRTELSTGEKLCLCSERDFCNSATRSVLSLVSLFLFMTLLL